MIMRCIVALVALSVFVAGCSQSSESQTQDAREIESAGVGVPAASSPSDQPSGSIEIDSDMRENQEVGGASTSATSPYETATELPGEIVDMI